MTEDPVAIVRLVAGGGRIFTMDKAVSEVVAWVSGSKDNFFNMM